MRYDVIFGNPPFQNNLTRNKTQHKLWKEFTIKALDEWLAEGGVSLLDYTPIVGIPK